MPSWNFLPVPTLKSRNLYLSPKTYGTLIFIVDFGGRTLSITSTSTEAAPRQKQLCRFKREDSTEQPQEK